MPKTTLANTCKLSSGAGVDQGANMYTCTGGLSVSFNPAQPKLGDTVNFTISLKDPTDQNDFKSMGADLRIWVKNDSWFSSDENIFNKVFTGNSFQDKFIAGGSTINKAGNYTLHIEVSYQVTGAVSQMYSFVQDNQITVLAADSTGGPKLNVNTNESFADGPNITKGIRWTYLDGGSGKQAVSYKVDCGDSKGVQNVPSGQTSFRCVYGKTAQDYTAKVYAYDASGNQLVVQGITLSVTGQESTQGAGQNGDQATPGVIRGFINLIVGMVFGIIQEILYAIFYILIVPIMQAMLSIRTYTDTFVSVIYPGWIVLRNLCNIIFIIAIMVIAMGTLLRVDSYKSRSVLVQLILAALLVNFSLVIAQVILGVADTVQNQFLPNNAEVIRALAKDLMVAYRSTLFDLNLTGYWSGLVLQFMLLILSFGSFMVFLAIAAFLFIRIIMLWILLMLSPLAYAAGALPSTAHYRTEWWTTFLKYAFFTPIMAFFLNLTAIIATTYKTNPIFGALGIKDSDFGGGTAGSIAGFVFRAGSTLLLIVFLIVALKVAESFSIFGAGEISKFAKGGMFLPVKALKTGVGAGAGAVGRAYAKWTTGKIKTAQDIADKSGKKIDQAKAFGWRAAQMLNPTVAKRAWEERKHDKELEAYTEAVGHTRDTLNRFMPTEWSRDHHTGKLKLGQKTYYGKIGHDNMIAHKRSEWEKAHLTMEEKVEAFLGAKHGDEVEALMYIMGDGRHENDYMLRIRSNPEWKEKYEKKLAAQKKLQLLDQGMDEATATKMAQDWAKKNAKAYYDKVEYPELLLEKLKEGHVSEPDALKRIAHLQEWYEGEQKGRGIGMVVVDEDGETRLASDITFYKNVDEQKGHGEFLKQLNKLGIFEEVKDPSGNLTALKFKIINKKNGKEIEPAKVITDYASLQSAISETKSKYDNHKDHAYKQADLGYAIAGRRGWVLDASIRANRGKGEGWAASQEAGQDSIQEEDGSYIGSTSFGEAAFTGTPLGTTTAYGKSRNPQSRAPVEIGMRKDARGQIVVDYLQFAMKYKENKEWIKAFIDQQKLTKEWVQKNIIDKINSAEVYRDEDGEVVDLKAAAGLASDAQMKIEDFFPPSKSA